MDRYCRGTSQRRGHSADIQSALGFMVLYRPGKLPGGLTCLGNAGAQNTRFRSLGVVAVRTKPTGSLPGGGGLGDRQTQEPQVCFTRRLEHLEEPPEMWEGTRVTCEMWGLVQAVPAPWDPGSAPLGPLC